MDRDIGSVKRITARRVRSKSARARDLGAGVRGDILAEWDHERGGVADHAPASFRQKLPLGKGRRLRPVDAPVVLVRLRIIGIGRPVTFHDRRDVLQFPRANLYLSVLYHMVVLVASVLRRSDAPRPLAPRRPRRHTARAPHAGPTRQRDLCAGASEFQGPRGLELCLFPSRRAWHRVVKRRGRMVELRFG